jgi:hypothetical protein
MCSIRSMSVVRGEQRNQRAGVYQHVSCAIGLSRRSVRTLLSCPLAHGFSPGAGGFFNPSLSSRASFTRFPGASPPPPAALRGQRPTARRGPSTPTLRMRVLYQPAKRLTHALRADLARAPTSLRREPNKDVDGPPARAMTRMRQPLPLRDRMRHSRRDAPFETRCSTRDGMLHSRRDAPLETGCSTRDGMLHSRRDAPLETGCSTRDGMLHSRRDAPLETGRATASPSHVRNVLAKFPASCGACAKLRYRT